jgi:glutamyl-tRNA synthetase
MRVRFAPSPTGLLHIGNARTALANYLVAAKKKVPLVLRIEDTDQERSTKEFEQTIFNDLKWLGIKWSEAPDVGGNYGPYRQSERFDIYKKYTERLLAEGQAYLCFCSTEELDLMRQEAEKQNRPFVYPRKCLKLAETEKKKLLAQGRKPTIRFKVPDNQTVVIKDHIKGEVPFNSNNIGGDFIIVRSDGTPVYNYIVIIDDALMKITHVIRGEDHLPNTPKQVLIGQALGLSIPEYAHHALVLGEDRAKLSKRHGITSVALYRKQGYLPEAITNYLALLGWAPSSGKEILALEDIVQEIEISTLANTAAIFDFKKLKWMNSIYIRNYPLNQITDLFIPYIQETDYSLEKVNRSHLEDIISIIRGNCEILSDIKDWIGLFLEDDFKPDEAADLLLQEEGSQKIIVAANKLLDQEISSHNFMTEIVPRIKEKTSCQGKNLFHPIRAMLTGKLQGPELDLALPIIGFTRCQRRIKSCFKRYC